MMSATATTTTTTTTSSNTTAEDNSELDPQIQIELENLNTATDEINKLEIELEEANSTFRILLNESTRRLKLSSKRLGNCIEKARPYYEALEKARESQIECQKAAVKFQRANEIHIAAKETVALAEQRFLSNSHEWQFDNAWQEMLNHATQKVMDAEKQKAECHAEHQRRTEAFKFAELRVQQLEDRFKRSITKSRPYFEEKQICQDQLQTQKNRIQELQQQVQAAKNTYSTALRNLERISNDIHRQRGNYPPPLSGTPPPGPREPGVGAELNTPTSTTSLPPLPDFQLELEKCDYPSIAGSQMSLGSNSQRSSEYSVPGTAAGAMAAVVATTTMNQATERDVPAMADETEELDDEEHAHDYAENNELRGVVDEKDLEELRQKVKILAVRPIEGGDGQQQQQHDVWEHELKATVDRLDHLMMLKECAKHQEQQKLMQQQQQHMMSNGPRRPDSLGAEAQPQNRYNNSLPPASVDDADSDGVVVVLGKSPLIKFHASTNSNEIAVCSSLPATPEHNVATKPLKKLQKLAPLPSVNVSMRELPLLARLSNELLDCSNMALSSNVSNHATTATTTALTATTVANKQRRRSLE